MGSPVPIAVIGLGCRLPGGANNLEQLWDMLAEGRSGWGEVPAERWNWKSFYHPDSSARESLNSKSGYFLPQNIAAFDARFFGIPPSEAHGIDPQQRLLLETTFEAIENAGIPLDSLRGSDTSVHVAVFSQDYDRMAYKDLQNLHKMHVTGKGLAILSNRISYLLDLKGPSMTIDTGCSGSLVALHQACQTIRNGDSKVAIVGGAQLILHPDQSMTMNQVGMTNPEGRCFVFDDRGSGYARGEGAGAVVLKRLDLALQDGDPIHAVIRNSGINQDGKTMGIQLPDADAQAALAKSVYAAVGLDPGKTLYVEAHGTGTQAGDAIEVASISRVFCEDAKREGKLNIGSIKSNIGHLESVSGIAGFLKAVVILKNGLIPPNIDLINPKPSLKLDERNIEIPLQVTPLAPPEYSGPRHVSVNGFGYGGTNCHVILESITLSSGPSKTPNGVNGVNGVNKEHAVNGTHLSNGVTNHTVPDVKVNGHGHSNGTTNRHNHSTDGRESTPELFVLSASSKTSLSSMKDSLNAWISNLEPGSNQLRDLAYTLGVRRSLHSWRYSFVASNASEATSQLSQAGVGELKAAKFVNLTYVFTGQGAQWFGMGRELLSASKAFRNSIAISDARLKDRGCPWSLIEELLKSKEESHIGKSEIAQPATTAIQIALVDLLHAFGITPQRVCGHSSGEIAAAYAAGALTHEAAIEIAYHRGICSMLAKKYNDCQGSMLAVGADAVTVTPYLLNITQGRLTVACINSPESTTISGDEVAVDELKETLDGLGIFNRKLNVETAYHSHHMETVSDNYFQSIENIPHGTPREGIIFFSSVTGKRKTDAFGPLYWTKNLVSQVKFSQAVYQATEDITASTALGADVLNEFVELGPHSALMGPLRQTLAKASGGTFKYHYNSALMRDKNAVCTVLGLVGRLFEAGYSVRMQEVLDLDQSDRKPSVIHNLPPYPWDHSSTYWHESRLSKEHRQRHFPYHDLLGLFDVTSNFYEPRWRHHLSTNSLPWLRDHQVDGFIIFPGSGYLCMAIEAMNQLIQLRKVTGSVKRFVLRDVTFSKSIVIPEQSNVEVQLTLSPVNAEENSRWETFRIFSYHEGSWSEHCTGLISADMTDKIDEVEGTREEDITTTSLLETLEEIKNSSSKELDTDDVYNALKASGNVFGPTFRAMSNIKIGDSKAVSTIHVPDVAKTMPGSYMQPHIIHPTTLDALNQLSPVIFKEQCSNAPVMPVFMGEVTVSASISNAPGTELLAAVQITTHGPRLCKGDTWVFQVGEDGELLQPVVTASNWQLRAIGEAPSNKDSVPFSRKMCYKVDWPLDVDYLTKEAFHDRISEAGLFDVPAQTGGLSGEIEIPLNEKAAAIYIRSALSQVDAENVTAPHFVKLLEWMRSHIKSETASQYLLELSHADEKTIIQESVESGVIGQALHQIGTNLQEILVGKANPLDILLRDNLLHKIYAESLAVSSSLQLAKYAELLACKLPRMNILEIGAGTGSATLPLLQALTDAEGLRLDRYNYTDISSGFFQQARSKFSDWEEFLDFGVLDISKDPLEQGYSPATYDLVVASNVLHATPSLDTTLANIRKILKPGGRLALIEVTSVIAAVNIIFGTLPGWWLSEDGRKGSPLISELEWHNILLQHGFDGIEVATPDHVGPAALTSMIITKAVDTDSRIQTSSTQVTILREHKSAFTESVSDELLLLLKQAGLNCQKTELEAFEVDPDATYIVLDCAEQPLLLDPSQELFKSIKSILNTCNNVLWVGFQESDSPEATASKGMISGMSRVLRRENESSRLVTLDVNENFSTVSAARLAKALTQVATSSFWRDNQNDGAIDREYAYQNGLVSVARLLTDHKFNKWAERLTTSSSSQTEICAYRDFRRPLKIEAETPGFLNSLRFVDDPKPGKVIAPNEILVEAHAYGVNFKDVFVALGQMPPEALMVGEFSGVVKAVGFNIKDMYQVGDRVAGATAEPFASYPRVNGLLCHKLPDCLSFVEGAAAVTVFYTVWYCFEHIARLRKGQSVLIHAASGGVGQAAIQYAQHIGTEIFVTVGSSAKRQLIIDKYNIPESHIFSTRSTTFKQGVLRLTKNKGVDAVLNSLSGEALASSWECMAHFGTFLEIGKTDIYKRRNLHMAQFDKSVTFAAVDVALLGKERPEMIHTGLQRVFSMFEEGAFYPVHPVTPFPMEQVEDAFRLIAARKHTGKIVLTVDENTQVKAIPLKPAALQLDINGTYVVAGGLGDLGKRICRLLAKKGAGHIVTLSRRNISEDTLNAFKGDIEQLGGNLHVIQCDITDRASLLEAKSFCQANLPPVRGIVHAGMVLRDHPLEYMSLEDYNAAVRPKVHGTINLQEAFSSPDLAFFIALSSIAGVLGMKGQSNYAAGNTFQDAFAYAYSAANPHTRYITIDLGAIDGSDSITLLPIRQAELERQSAILMTFDELFTVLEYAMGPQAVKDAAVQCITGFNRTSMEAIEDRFALNDPLFSLVPRERQQNRQSNKDSTADKANDPGRVLQDAKSMEEGLMIITKVTADKFSEFLDASVPVDVPIAQLALDSLVSIELKNWMVRTFEAPLQSSELAGALSITALAKLIASRSKYLKKLGEEDGSESASKPELTNGEQETDGESHTSDTDIPSHGWACCKHAKVLPRYPLVDLDEALDYFLENTGHFFTPANFKTLQHAVEELRGPTSRQAYAEIVKRYDDQKLDSWMYDLISDAVYLKRTHPVAPYSNVMGTHYDSKVPHSQSERAAVIAVAAWKFKLSVDANRQEPFWYFGMSSCTWQWQWLFNATRIPRVGGDVMQMYKAEHCVVLRRGHVFKVMLRENGEDVQYAKFKAIFEAILNHVNDDGEWLGILTTDVRDSWATMREKVLAISTDNLEYLEVIDTATFLICLDDGNPESAEERVRDAYLGDGFNRWQDKCTQFIVSANGRSSFIMEHGAIDGMTAARSCDWVHKAIQTHEPEVSRPTTPFPVEDIHLEEYFFKSTPEVDEHILVLRERYIQNTSAFGYKLHTLTAFGTTYLMNAKVPPKAVIDATLQLAVRMHFGNNTPCWEGVSMAHYHKGRPEIMQVVTRPVVEFCDAALDDTISLAHKRAMLLRLGRDMAANMQKCLTGRTHLRLFDLLHLLWPKDEPLAQMFQEGLFWPTPFLMASHAPTGNSVCDSAYGLQEPNSFWIMITPGDESVRFAVTGPSDGRTQSFCERLDEAAEIVKNIVDSNIA